MTDENELIPEDFEIESAGDAFDMIEITMDRLLDTGSVDMVFGEPIQHGDTVIIPCSEAFTVIGMGAGYGYGSAPIKHDEGEGASEPSEGGGGGGGGGGRTFARPVAVVVASPEGVRVEPVVDVTKIVLAALTAVGFMGSLMVRMNSSKRALRTLRGSDPL
jgi:uncharacterized spore protein YtfJ